MAAQVEANVRKLKNIWVDRHTVETIAKKHTVVNGVLCHGTRNAAEQKYFAEFFPSADIIGTEISHTATEFPMTVQWDFHEINPDWVAKFDIVYSNAIDHSYDPVKAIKVWSEQLIDQGVLYLEHAYAPQDNYSRASDPLEIYDEEIREILQQLNLNLIEVFDTTGIKGRCPCKVYVINK